MAKNPVSQRIWTWSEKVDFRFPLKGYTNWNNLPTRSNLSRSKCSRFEIIQATERLLEKPVGGTSSLVRYEFNVCIGQFMEWLEFLDKAAASLKLSVKLLAIEKQLDYD